MRKRKMHNGRWITPILAVAFLALGCQRASAPAAVGGASAKAVTFPIGIVATTGMVADLVKGIGGAHVQVTGLMGPGVDPHLYKASAGDTSRLSSAAMIFYSGLNLEGKMGDLFVKMARTRPVVAITERIDESLLREPPEFAGHFDPHLWFDVGLWSQTADTVAQALADFDPAHAAEYRANAKRLVADWQVLHAWCREQIARIPPAQRVLVTAHDAFGYFGRAYNMEVLGLQGVSTVSEFGLADVQRIVDLLVARKIPAIFVESSVPRRSIEAVVAGARARGHEVKIGGTLYSDAMGTPGTVEGTYVGMVRANVRTIVDALASQVAVK